MFRVYGILGHISIPRSNDSRNFPATGPTPLIDQRRTELLMSIARDVGLDFRPDDFARVYLPQPIVHDLQLRDLQRRSALNAILAQPPAVTPLPLPPQNNNSA